MATKTNSISKRTVIAATITRSRPKAGRTNIADGAIQKAAKPRATSKPVKVTSPAGRDPKLTQVAFEKISNAIVYGRLDLGEPISENDLAKALGVSKAPIRESLNELRLKGLVVVVPQSGSYVFSPTSEQIEELCDFRSLLETRSMRVSMQNDAKLLISELRKTAREMERAYRMGDIFLSKKLDTDFHQAFIRHSGNRYLQNAYANIGPTVEALRYRFLDTAVYRNRAFDEHKKIVDSLALNNITKAVDVLEDHIARTKHFHARVTWTTGRLRRKDYKFRDYSDIFAEA
ncbi:MAG: GntR family transcriptional regulator [Edaphobacter sp.]